MDTVVISADSHLVEPPSIWAERIDRRFRDRAPRTVKNLDGRDGEFFVCENIDPKPVGGFWSAGIPKEQMAEFRKRGFERAPAFITDPAARLEEQDRDGVSAEVLYPSMGMLLYGVDDGELRSACFRAYNDWALDFCSHDPKRLIASSLISLEDVDDAVGELERVVARGVRAALIWAEPPTDKPYSDPDYDKFWAAAEGSGVALSLHALTSRQGTMIESRNMCLQGSLLHQEVERTLAALVLDGILERHPDLRIVSAENEVGWLSYLLWRMDTLYPRLAPTCPVPLTMLPSDYVKRQVWATFIDDPMVENTFKFVGSANLMWSSDFPHGSSTYPRSRDYITTSFGDLAVTDRRNLLHDNVCRVYGLA